MHAVVLCVAAPPPLRTRGGRVGDDSIVDGGLSLGFGAADSDQRLLHDATGRGALPDDEDGVREQGEDPDGREHDEDLRCVMCDVGCGSGSGSEGDDDDDMTRVATGGGRTSDATKKLSVKL